MKIERVNERDAADLLEIYAPYVEKTAVSFEYEVPLAEEFAERIRKISAEYPYIKAVDDNGEILGFAYAAKFKDRAAYDYAVETTIYVRENQRRSGVGKALYDELENLLGNMGILNLNACIAYTSAEDEYLTNASMYFHERMGYTLVGTFHKCGYKFNKWYDMDGENYRRTYRRPISCEIRGILKKSCLTLNQTALYLYDGHINALW